MSNQVEPTRSSAAESPLDFVAASLIRQSLRDLETLPPFDLTVIYAEEPVASYFLNLMCKPQVFTCPEYQIDMGGARWRKADSCFGFGLTIPLQCNSESTIQNWWEVAVRSFKELSKLTPRLVGQLGITDEDLEFVTLGGKSDPNQRDGLRWIRFLIAVSKSDRSPIAKLIPHEYQRSNGPCAFLDDIAIRLTADGKGFENDPSADERSSSTQRFRDTFGSIAVLFEPKESKLRRFVDVSTVPTGEGFYAWAYEIANLPVVATAICRWLLTRGVGSEPPRVSPNRKFDTLLEHPVSVPKTMEEELSALTDALRTAELHTEQLKKLVIAVREGVDTEARSIIYDNWGDELNDGDELLSSNIELWCSIRHLIEVTSQPVLIRFGFGEDHFHSSLEYVLKLWDRLFWLLVQLLLEENPDSVQVVMKDASPESDADSRSLMQRFGMAWQTQRFTKAFDRIEVAGIDQLLVIAKREVFAAQRYVRESHLGLQHKVADNNLIEPVVITLAAPASDAANNDRQAQGKSNAIKANSVGRRGVVQSQDALKDKIDERAESLGVPRERLIEIWDAMERLGGKANAIHSAVGGNREKTLAVVRSLKDTPLERD